MSDNNLRLFAQICPDGTYRPNFRPMPIGKDFNVERYAAGVANELLWALEGLVGED